MEAELTLSICERFGCLPSQLMQEDAYLLRLLRIEALAHPERTEAANKEEVN